ncbi:MAG: DUF3108 domain-containing protein [Draconibacterium sp.]|nr:DUF3108 domain-containing protein [Draconibacterium sp.]
MKKALIIFLLMFLVLQTVLAKKESIRFDLKFGFIKGGEAELVITDTFFNGRPAIHYYVVGRTTGFTNTLFGVNDVYETTVDAETRLPLKAIRNIKEKKYRWYNETLFYHDRDSLNSQRTGWRKMPENMVDLISAFFYFINKYKLEEMEINKKISLSTFHADKIDTVSIVYLGSAIINTDLGDINSYVLAPVVDKGKLLKRSDGLKFFMSKEQKVPVMLEFDMKVGALRAVLKSYKIDGVEQVTK